MWPWCKRSNGLGSGGGCGLWVVGCGLSELVWEVDDGEDDCRSRNCSEGRRGDAFGNKR